MSLAPDASTASPPRHPSGGECECSACDVLFSSITGFDLHQWWPKGRLVCLDPAAVGLVAFDRRGRTVWRMPGPDEDLPSPAVARKAAIALQAQILGLPVPRGRG